MKILHLSQAVSPNQFFGGGEYTEATLIKQGLEKGHEIVSINAKGEIFEWNQQTAGRVGFDGFLLFVEWCDAVWVGNIEWLIPELTFAIIDRARKSKKIFYYPQHFTPCPKIGLPGTYKEICESECGGIYACQTTFRWDFYRWIMSNATRNIYVSPLQRDIFLDAYGEEGDFGFEAFAPPLIPKGFYDNGVPRFLDAVCVGGGTYQKGLKNHIAWARKHEDRDLTIYGRLEIKPNLLPPNLKYGGMVDNDTLPDILNLFRTFVYHPKCQESYARTVVEAVLCGCELDIDTDKIGAFSYKESIAEQQAMENAFWDVIEKSDSMSRPNIALEDIVEKHINKISDDDWHSDKTGINIAVIMSAYNQYDYTIKCLDSLSGTLTSGSTIIFVNDGSTDATNEITSEFAKERWPNLNMVLITHNTTPQNCTACWNEGIDWIRKSGDKYYDYIVIANNDMIFSPNWVRALIEDQKVFGADIIGPMSNAPGDRPAQEIERLISEEWDTPYILTDNITQIENLSYNMYNHVTNNLPIQVSAVNGFCMMMPMSTVDAMYRLRGSVFNKDIESFGNEDELQMAMAQEGMFAFVSRRSFVFHYCNVSFKDRNNRGKVRRDSLLIRSKGVDASLETLMKRLDSSDKVSFLRFGDGEIALMENSGMDTANINDMVATPELRKEMTEAFNINDPNYLRAVSVNYPREKGMIDGLFAPFPYNEKLLQAISKIDTTVPEKDGTIEYENPILFHYLAVFRPEQYIAFLDKYIRPKVKIFVGCQPVDAMQRMFGAIHAHVKTPPKNSFAEVERIWKDLKNAVEMYDITKGTPLLVIMATGQTSNILQKRLWELDVRVHCIDIGSVVDAITGDDSRTWIKIAGGKIQKCLLESE